VLERRTSAFQGVVDLQEFAYKFDEKVLLDQILTYIDNSRKDFMRTAKELKDTEDPRTYLEIFNTGFFAHYNAGNLGFNAKFGEGALGIGFGGVAGESVGLGFTIESMVEGTTFIPLSAYFALDKLIDLTWGNVFMHDALREGAALYLVPNKDKGLDIKILPFSKSRMSEPIKIGVWKAQVGMEIIKSTLQA
jgi:hypothetical protein